LVFENKAHPEETRFLLQVRPCLGEVGLLAYLTDNAVLLFFNVDGRAAVGGGLADVDDALVPLLPSLVLLLYHIQLARGLADLLIVVD